MLFAFPLQVKPAISGIGQSFAAISFGDRRVAATAAGIGRVVTEPDRTG